MHSNLPVTFFLDNLKPALPSRHHRHLPGCLPCRLHRDLHVLPERSQELDQPPNGEIAGAVAHQRGHMRLLDTENLASLRLGKAARLEDLVDLQRQAGLEQVLFWIWQAEVSEDVAAAGLRSHSCFCFLAHPSSAFLYEAAPLRQSAF